MTVSIINSKLPLEILEAVLNKLDDNQLKNCRLVCKKWSLLIRDSQREKYKKLAEIDFPNIFKKYTIIQIKDWEPIYKGLKYSSCQNVLAKEIYKLEKTNEVTKLISKIGIAVVAVPT